MRKDTELKRFDPVVLRKKLERIDPITLETLVHHVCGESSIYSVDVFEQVLKTKNLITVFQTWEILDKVNNPNPYSPLEQLPQHENWWANHPQERDQFDNDSEIYQRQLHALFVGFILSNSLKNI